jgi:hypothetical protein
MQSLAARRAGKVNAIVHVSRERTHLTSGPRLTHPASRPSGPAASGGCDTLQRHLAASVAAGRCALVGRALRGAEGLAQPTAERTRGLTGRASPGAERGVDAVLWPRRQARNQEPEDQQHDANDDDHRDEHGPVLPARARGNRAFGNRTPGSAVNAARRSRVCATIYRALVTACPLPRGVAPRRLALGPACSGSPRSRRWDPGPAFRSGVIEGFVG